MIRFLAAAAFSLLALASPAHAQSMLDGTFAEDIPTLEQVAGHRSGARITPPEQAVAYFEALAEAAPDRFRIFEYATSWEGRPLVYAVVTSADNMARLEAVQADLTRLGNGTPPAQLANILPVTWLTYGVHGNEISSTDAALSLAYHLLASEGDAIVDAIMANTIVVIDPSQNPDGRARFVHEYRQQLGIQAFGDRGTAGHDEPWPGGRTNHYLFDLNRDWFALTQPETRGKVAAVRDWHPVVLVDAHEMGGDESYFFPPSADPFNPHIPQDQRDKQMLLGRNIATWMDRFGQPYFTREVFDAFYPGYGDTWPTLNGSIAMTFEQASARGLVWERKDGTMLTYADGVRNHFLSTLATAQTVAENPNLFLNDYAAYRRSAISGGAGTGTYVIDLSQKRWNAEQLARRLAFQGIAVSRVAGPATACGRRYPAGYLAVSRSQGAARLIRSLLDATTDLPADYIAGQEARRDADLPHELYDTTAWSVGMMSGLDVALCGSAATGSAISAEDPVTARADAPGAFGLAVRWTDSGQVRLVAEALRAGLVGRTSDTAFTAGAESFPRGSVVFSRGDNAEKIDELTMLASRIGAEVIALDSGWVDSGPNLGSDKFVRLTMPRVAMLWDDGVNPLSAGAMRYVLEQRLGIAVAPIRTGSVDPSVLSAFQVLLVPDGNYGRALGNDGRSAIASYARNGGVVVVLGDAMAGFSDGDNALFALARETALGTDPTDEEGSERLVAGSEIGDEGDYREAIADPSRRPDILPGALLNTAIDRNVFLSAGYDDAAPVVFAAGDLIFAPLGRDAGHNVVRFADAGNLLASGYMWDENRRQMAFKPFMVAQPAGSGMAIGFTHDPSQRGYLDGLDMLIANAVLIAPARVR
ncbi:M14 metallopeptidase family protein [Alteraurantiacibacter aquimixticola]|uniref:Carboxypeptidase n=1 Tax=Alteraurantiacibacter aquimixticola TaxID=2489173 RepID=A0A4T3F4M8_9SPHN|nr:M14 metallopeptidase family protein [Alteraurantiacibacter aquimixticola]TIX50458.1 carboxypeptidase [Alteraurantiacibacter aquimixticola]